MNNPWHIELINRKGIWKTIPHTSFESKEMAKRYGEKFFANRYRLAQHEMPCAWVHRYYVARADAKLNEKPMPDAYWPTSQQMELCKKLKANGDTNTTIAIKLGMKDEDVDDIIRTSSPPDYFKAMGKESDADMATKALTYIGKVVANRIAAGKCLTKGQMHDILPGAPMD